VGRPTTIAIINDVPAQAQGLSLHSSNQGAGKILMIDAGRNYFNIIMNGSTNGLVRHYRNKLLATEDR